MPISTNSIIHYTDSFEKLGLILKEGLGVKYCAESLKITGSSSSNAAHPMISFCDIPLSQSYKHFDAYGNYGIGLTKEWANEKGVNPVLYMEPNSSVSKTLGKFLSERRNKADTNLTTSQRNDILRIRCFAKNYSGILKRNKINDRDYKFYDEREWRLVPEKDVLGNEKFSIDRKSYLKNKALYNQSISKIRFTFLADDISYIIVNKTIEIPKVIQIIKSVYTSKCSKEELDILVTKIVSTEQILSDY